MLRKVFIECIARSLQTLQYADEVVLLDVPQLASVELGENVV